MAQNNPLYPFKKIMIKSKTMKQNNKILNKTLAINMRLKQSQKYSKPKTH
ncbi:hypothetical protein OUO_1545 [Helicobacter pylori R046Wa]|nr:hypothetical protein OUO_1545 [Helicobacter pylori R046Wa]